MESSGQLVGPEPAAQRDQRRRRLILRGLVALLLNDVIAVIALGVAATLGLIPSTWRLVAGALGFGVANFVVTAAWLAVQREVTRRFARSLRFVASAGQLSWTAYALWIGGAVRPLGLILTSIMFATMLRGVSRAEAAFASTVVAVSYVAGSVLGTWWLGQPDRLVEDLFYVSVWIPVALVTSSLVGRAQDDRRTVERQRRQLEAMAEERTRFYQRVSHELRTPLTMLLGPLGLELQRVPDNRNVQVALNHVARLQHLVDQLLDLEALTSGSEELATEDLDLARLVTHFVESYFATGVPRDVSVRVDAPDRVFAHASRRAVATVLFNLVSNALKHAPRHSSITIRVRALPDVPVETSRASERPRPEDSEAAQGREAESRPDRVVAAELSVEDEGEGIAPEDQARLFEDFARMPDSPHGTGLGLALTRRLVEAMQGGIGVESRRGAGARFWVQLPQGRTTEERPAPRDGVGSPRAIPAPEAPWSAPDDADLAGPWLLVVEDHAELRAHVCEVLEELGLPVVGAPDGEAAWGLVRRSPPRLVVSDWVMPRLDGPGLIRRLRDDPELGWLPIVLLTANSDAENRRMGVALGANAFLGKPFHPVELLSAVRNLLRLTEREHVLKQLHERVRQQILGRFLPPRLVDDIVAGRADLDDALRASVVTVLVVDIAGYGALARQLPVTRLGELLRRHLSEASRIVFEHGGTVETFVGARLVALFGAPREAAPADQVTSAVTCARALLAQLRGSWTDAVPGGVELAVGLHHGTVAVGMIGSEHRTEYAAVGATALEALEIGAAAAPGSITASKAVVDLLPSEDAAKIQSIGGSRYELEAPGDRAPPAAHARLGPGDTVSGYRVVREIGRGGLGVVYAVEDEHTGVARALKVLHAELQRDQRPRLLQEAQLQMRLRHENIVPVLHVVEVDRTIGLVMPLVEGRTLFTRLADGGLAVDEAVALFRGIVAGVAEIHAHHVVHRDLKPENVLLLRRGEREVPMVADFGLARLLQRGPLTRGGAFLGTPGYAPPEQHLDARSVTRAADVWSLGVILYEMLTGRRPFGAPEPFGVPAYDAVYDTRGLPDPWRGLIGWMLQPEPDRRPATAAHVARAIDALADPARPDPAAERTQEVPRAVLDAALHLADERLVATLTPSETGHLASCARCRERRARALHR